jgi:uncharacterized protein YeaO (DUF488 family)
MANDAFSGRVAARGRAPIAWPDYLRRFRAEMEAYSAQQALAEYAARIADGETITLLCHCADAARCHRSLVAELIAARVSGR